ncbi:MAG: hypothetical protein KJ760_20100, partial [Proteobacteria bacterium]|nr:hypothetical protein [Pseudomonadota bacterium]
APCIKFISNLPYYISSPIIEKVLMMKNWSVAVFMVQKEFADRIFSKPGTKQYSSLTLFVHFYAEAKKLFNVSRHCFRPVPSVDSTVIMLKRRPLSKRQLSVSGVMFKLIRGAFTHRRKTMLNSLKISLRTPWVLPAAAGRVPVEQLLREAFARNEINPSARPEEISPEKFFSLSLLLQSHNVILTAKQNVT